MLSREEKREDGGRKEMAVSKEEKLTRNYNRLRWKNHRRSPEWHLQKTMGATSCVVVPEARVAVVFVVPETWLGSCWRPATTEELDPRPH